MLSLSLTSQREEQVSSSCPKCHIVMVLQGSGELEITVVVVDEVFVLEDIAWSL